MTFVKPKSGFFCVIGGFGLDLGDALGPGKPVYKITRNFLHFY